MKSHVLLASFVAALVSSLFPMHAAAQADKAQTVSACGTPNNTPVVGVEYPITQDPTGKLCTSGSGGGGGASVTQRNSVAAVTAGTGQPLYGDSANGGILTELCKPGTTTCVDPTAPTGVLGQDGATIMSATNPFAVQAPLATNAGNITVQNSNPTGTPTAGSALAVAMTNQGACTVQVTGTWTASGGLSGQVTSNNVNWITLGSATTFLDLATGTQAATIPSGNTDIWQLQINAPASFRMTALGAVTGTAGLNINCAAGTGQVAVLNTPATNLAQAAGTTLTVNAGAVAAGSPRVAVGQDTTTIAGSAPGVAGTPSANVVSIQGVTSGSPVITGGNVASGTADSGNPGKIGCVYHATTTAQTDGTRQDAVCDKYAFLRTTISGWALTGADGVTNSSFAWPINSSGANAFIPVAASKFNGSTWDRDFTCANTASVNVTAGNTTQIVGLSGSTVIRVCSFTLGISANGTFAFTSGTGTNCGTPANAMAAIPINTGSLAAQSAPSGGSLYRGSAGGEFCITAATGNVTGFVTYAQF